MLADGDLSADRILHFLENKKFPLVTIMTEANSAKVYASPKKLQVTLPQCYIYYFSHIL